jgi:protein TonB
MFGGFEKRKDADAAARYGIAALVAALLLSSAGAGAVALSARGEKKKEEVDEIIVEFENPEKPDLPPPPPPPPPPTRKIETAVARPAPSLAPPPPPAKIERDPLPRGDAEKFVANTGGGDEGGDVAAEMTAMDLGGGGGPARPAAAVAKPPPPPPKPKAARASNDPIVLPENAVQAKPQPGNAVPEYPGDARAAGLEGDVFLKIVINADGTVGDIEVKKGEEPFVSAAIAAVKTWKYSPAQVDGQPVTAYRVIKVPFRLSN